MSNPKTRQAIPLVKEWACNECGHRMTLAQATRASRNTQGCPKCGGADIDLLTSSMAGMGLL